MIIHLADPRNPWKELREKQRAYIVRLIKLGKLPSFYDDVAFNLDDPNHQTLIRDIVGFWFEEMAEAEDSLYNLYTRMKEHEELDFIKESLKDYNEEVADVMCFYLEIMDLIGLKDNDIRMYTEALVSAMPQYNPATTRTADILNMTFKLGEQAVALFLTADHPMWTISSHNYKDTVAEEDYTTHGARLLGYDNYSYHKKDTYASLIGMGKALNTLKNKPWKTYETPTDVNTLKLKVTQSFLEFIASLAYLGFRDTQLARITLHKIKINHDRLDN